MATPARCPCCSAELRLLGASVGLAVAATWPPRPPGLGRRRTARRRALRLAAASAAAAAAAAPESQEVPVGGERRSQVQNIVETLQVVHKTPPADCVEAQVQAPMVKVQKMVEGDKAQEMVEVPQAPQMIVISEAAPAAAGGGQVMLPMMVDTPAASGVEDPVSLRVQVVEVPQAAPQMVAISEAARAAAGGRQVMLPMKAQEIVEVPQAAPQMIVISEAALAAAGGGQVMLPMMVDMPAASGVEDPVSVRVQAPMMKVQKMVEAVEVEPKVTPQMIVISEAAHAAAGGGQVMLPRTVDTPAASGVEDPVSLRMQAPMMKAQNMVEGDPVVELEPKAIVPQVPQMTMFSEAWVDGDDPPCSEPKTEFPCYYDFSSVNALSAVSRWHLRATDRLQARMAEYLRQFCDESEA